MRSPAAFFYPLPAPAPRGILFSRYLRGVGLIARIQDSTVHYYLHNAHGDVVQLVDQNGTKLHSYRYDAFGNEKDANENDVNPFRYCGEYWDKETETLYLRNRNYDPRIGRFGAMDTHWGQENMIYGDKPQEINARSLDDPLRLRKEAVYLPSLTAIMQSSNLYVYGINNPVKYADATGAKVYIIGGEFMAQAGFRLNFARGIIWDDQGNWGIVDSASFGGGLLGVGSSGYYAEIDAPHISDIQGGSMEFGGSFSLPFIKEPIFGSSPGYGCDLTITLGEQQYTGIIHSVGGSIGPLPVEAHGQITYSSVTDSPLDLALRLMHPIYAVNLGAIFNDMLEDALSYDKKNKTIQVYKKRTAKENSNLKSHFKPTLTNSKKEINRKRRDSK